jgi:hypothetical protein
MEKVFYLNIPVFIIAFIGGLIYVYITLPKPKAIIKYPTPYNFNKYTYKGLSDDCYKFKAKEVKCTSNTLPQPII